MDKEQHFTAEVKISGINPYIDVPEHVVNELEGGAKAAVLVKVAGIDPVTNEVSAPQGQERLAHGAERLQAIGRLAPGGWFRTTLVPLQSDPTRLYLDMWMRETAGVGVGDRVRITLKPDRGSRELPMPAELHQALAANERAMVTWEALAPSRRREILSYLNFLKTPAALERNVQKVIASLLAE